MVDAGEEGFRQWVALRRAPLRRSAYLMCGDWHLADDLVQEAMWRLFAVWDRVVRRGDPEAYARRILVRLVIDHRRHRSRREVPVAVVPDEPAEVNLPDLPDIGEVLAGLPPRQRATLVLRFWEDFSVNETAAIMGCSAGTVKSTTSKALTHLRTTLASDPHDSAAEELT
jgi:RNA polymerase sigma-70 factor (sigma-E family)